MTNFNWLIDGGIIVLYESMKPTCAKTYSKDGNATKNGCYLYELGQRFGVYMVIDDVILTLVAKKKLFAHPQIDSVTT